MPSSRSATHRAGHGSNRSAASTAKTGTSSVLEPKSWRVPVPSTISLGAGISAAAARNSSMDPNGSALPCVNPVGTLMSGRCGASLPRQKRCPVQRSVGGQRFPATGIARLNIPSVNGHHFRVQVRRDHVEHAVITPTNHSVLRVHRK